MVDKEVKLRRSEGSRGGTGIGVEYEEGAICDNRWDWWCGD